MESYQIRKAQFSAEFEQLKTKSGQLSSLRLLVMALALASAFYGLKTQIFWFWLTAAFLVALFILLMRKHAKITARKQFCEALIAINHDEINFLERSELTFENGSEFMDFQHPYAHDLDIFGPRSLFQNLNRTYTHVGKTSLAAQLLQMLPQDQILENQKAIRELAAKLDWRQEFAATAKISNDHKAQYQTLIRWSKLPSAPVSRPILILAFATPALFFAAVAGWFVTKNPSLGSLISFLFVFNLGLLGQFFKRIKAEIQNAESLDKTIGQYGLLLQKIENEGFTAEKLKDLQQRLKGQATASAELKKLSALFSKMDSVGNFVTTLLFNGAFLFHIHVLKALLDWKKNHAENLKKWLEVIGEFEMLNSLANFSYNNPDFAFAELNQNGKIQFEKLSHPLLNPRTRISNDVIFDPKFMILTGSNMSGKSTFLRSLGINMVLAGIGAPVCATKALVDPLPVLVSMRLSDSLSDSESYFYAEIKRLKQIMDVLESQKAFVLLDEILRGTNSDDKRSGTISVVRKMVQFQAIGAIATHDIEVCATTDEFPHALTNQCFEAEIINDDLHFDYKLRPGICKNKSATFLMKKMGVI